MIAQSAQYLGYGRDCPYSNAGTGKRFFSFNKTSSPIASYAMDTGIPCGEKGARA